MIKFLIFLMALASVGCSTISKADSSSVNPVIVEKTPVYDCSSALQEKIKPLFNLDEDGVDRDENFLNELKSRPREETINCLLHLRDKQKNDFELLAKTSYILIKLRHNEYENGKILVSSFLLYKETILKRYEDKNYGENVEKGKYDSKFTGEWILSFIADVIENHNKEILSETFSLVGHTDGASSELISHIFGDEFSTNPTNFLKILKSKSNPKKIREDVYLFIYYSIGKAKVAQLISKVPKDSDVYLLVKEIENFGKTNQYVSKMAY